MQQERLTWQKILSICRKNILLLTIFSLVFGLVGVGISKLFITPQYTATTQVLVYQKKSVTPANQQVSNNSQSDLQLINTYKDFILSRTVLQDVKYKVEKKTDKKVTIGHLQKQISVTSKQNSQIFTISIADSNPTEASLIANIVTNSFIEKVKSVMGLNNVTKITTATPPDKPNYPNLKINFIASFILGFVVGFIFILYKESSKRRRNNVTSV